MSLKYGQFCPVSKAAEVLGERWTILIIRELLLGTSRYRDFQRALSKISPTLLTKRLNQLVDVGLVVRQTAADRTHPEYHLTTAGQELQPIVIGLGEWGMKWTRGHMSEDELDVQLLMYDFCRRIDHTALPTGRAVIHFAFSRLPKFANWWIVITADRERELCVDHPGKDADITIRTDVRTMVEIWAGDTTIRAATKQGRLTPSGNAHLARSLSAWLRPGLGAHIRPSATPLHL